MCLLKEAKWDLTLKGRNRRRIMCILISLHLHWPLPWAEPVILQSLLPTVPILPSVCTTPWCWTFTLLQVLSTFYLQDHKTIALCGIITLQRSTWNQNHICVPLNLQLSVAVAISIIGFLFLLDHITISFCFCCLISMIYQLQWRH